MESQRPELIPAVRSNVLRSPGWLPHPVDADDHAKIQLTKHSVHVISERVGIRAPLRGQSQVYLDNALLVGSHAVQQPQVDDVYPDLRIYDLFQRLCYLSWDALLACQGFSRFPVFLDVPIRLDDTSTIYRCRLQSKKPRRLNTTCARMSTPGLTNQQ